MSAAPRVCVVCFLSVALLILTSCFGATPMVKRERGPNGEQLAREALDPSFVQPGLTTRNEVLSKLSMINTGYDDPHLFWGRWATSKWGYGWVIIAPGGGGGSAGGDAKRVWHLHNIIVTFDDQGLAQTRQILDDNPALWREFHKQMANLPPIDVSQPLTFAVGKYADQQITLAPEWIGVERSRGKVRSMRVAPGNISRISHSSAHDKRNNPGTSCHVLYFSEKTAFGKKLNFCTDGKNLLATFRYLQRYAPPNMQWE